MFMQKNAEPVYFTRQEMDKILGLYGFFVASGDWKDYAIDSLPDMAVFSVFRRASEAPLYRQNSLENKGPIAWSMLQDKFCDEGRNYQLC